jgi:hypothetical protein
MPGFFARGAAGLLTPGAQHGPYVFPSGMPVDDHLQVCDVSATVPAEGMRYNEYG